MTGLIAIVFAKLFISGKSIFLCVIVALTLGLVLGFINGLIIAKSKVTPLIVTLGMNYVFLGIALVVGGGRPQSITGQFEFLCQSKIGGVVPVSIIIFLLIFALAFLLRKYTKYGRRLNAIGGNPLA